MLLLVGCDCSYDSGHSVDCENETKMSFVVLFCPVVIVTVSECDLVVIGGA